MRLPFDRLTGPSLSLEPFSPALKEEVRAAIDCDPESWAILPVNATGEAFDRFYADACSASPGLRLVYAIRQRSGGRIVGMSTYYTAWAGHDGIEIGTTFLHPDVRRGRTNPEVKLTMLAHAFDAGARRVQFKVDARNARSLAAVSKLGAVREGVLRHDLRTWTGHMRDTVIFSILRDEWPIVRVRLDERLALYE